MPEYATLQVERDGPIATVWLNRPERLNALNRELMQDLTHAAEAFHDDIDTRVVIIAGRGRHFCAGADLDGARAALGQAAASPATRPAAPPPSRLRQRRDTIAGPRLIRALLDINQITIAAVHGAALGGGCCIPTACDFRIGSVDAFCGYPEIDRGMNLQWRALPLCVRLVGPARAKRMIILGRHEPAGTLLAWGFFDQVVPRAELMDAAQAMARDYAAQAPLPAQMIKQSVNAVANALDPAIMHMDHDQWQLTSSTDDYREGVRAFFEKRRPDFRGD